MAKKRVLRLQVVDHTRKRRDDALVEICEIGGKDWTPVPSVGGAFVVATTKAALELRVTTPDRPRYEGPLPLARAEQLALLVLAPPHQPAAAFLFPGAEDDVILYVRGQGARAFLEKRAGGPSPSGSRPHRIVDSASEVALLLHMPRRGPGRTAWRSALAEIVEDARTKRFYTELSIPVLRGSHRGALTGELVIGVPADTPMSVVASQVAPLELVITRRMRILPDTYVLRHQSGQRAVVVTMLEEVARATRAVHVEATVRRPAIRDLEPSNNLYRGGLQPAVEEIGVEAAYDQLRAMRYAHRFGDPAIVVAVIDPDPVSPTHPAITGTVSGAATGQGDRVVRNHDFTTNAPTSAESLGDHGTQCAATAVGRCDRVAGASGVAGNCRLIGARIPSEFVPEEVARAWRWATRRADAADEVPPLPAQGARVLSNSWGETWSVTEVGPDGQPLLVPSVLSESLRRMAGSATTPDVIVCFAAGNDGKPDLGTRRPLLLHPQVIAVGASIRAGAQQGTPGTRASYSNHGPGLALVAPSSTFLPTIVEERDETEAVVAAVRPASGACPANWTPRLTRRVNAEGQVSFPRGQSGDFGVNGARLIFASSTSIPRRLEDVDSGDGNELVVTVAEVPGTYVKLAWDRFDYDFTFGGTSYAAPLVAGAVALMLSRNYKLRWWEVRQILCETAYRRPGLAWPAQPISPGSQVVVGFRAELGHGRLDVGKAVKRAGTWGALPPPLPPEPGPIPVR